MYETHYEAIVIGSGAGGLALTYKLVTANKRVLVIEKGPKVRKNGNRSSADQIIEPTEYRTREKWRDRRGGRFSPDEYCNVGGKTKWYGAALVRLEPDEFEPDPSYNCLGWPFGYDELVRYYDEAEVLLGVRTFANEPHLRTMLQGICSVDGWRSEQLPLGLKAEILEDQWEAKHFDGFASTSGYKLDAETGLLDRIANATNLKILTGVEVVGLQHLENRPEHIQGVVCSDGRKFSARVVALAAGAMTSPRLLQRHLRTTALTLPCASVVGANYKQHMVSTIVAFTTSKNHDLLRKTAMLLNERYRHTSVQCLGCIDKKRLASRIRFAVPAFLIGFAAARASQYFVMTEDGSHLENRVILRDGAPPVLDYDVRRLSETWKEHRAARSDFLRRLIKVGMIGAYRDMRISGTSHAVGTMAAGNDPDRSAVDSTGKVHGMEGLYVADGSILPRSGRVNPGLTIYAWGLRVGEILTNTIL